MNSPSSSSRIAAFAILGMVVLIVIALLHHPVVGPHADVSQRFAQIAQAGAKDGLVHGALMAMLAVLACALAAFNRVFSGRSFALSPALSVYCLGCTLLGVAMLFDGFVVPDLAMRLSSPLSVEASVGELILRAIGITIQVFSKAGLVAQCIAILIWAYAAATAGRRWLSWIGAAAGLLPALLILFSDIVLTPHSLIAIFSAHTIWYLAVAGVLIQFAGAGRSNSTSVSSGQL